jgi:hypothetical protein
MPNYQDKRLSNVAVLAPADYKHEERLTKPEIERFNSILTSDNLAMLEYGAGTKKTQSIDTFINTNSDNRQLIVEHLQKARSTMGMRYKVTNESLLVKFFRFLVVKLPQRSVVFNIKKGHIITKRERRIRGFGLHISVKDPFLKLENHGYWLKSEHNFNLLILKMKDFIIETSKGRIEDFITSQYVDQDPDFEEDADERDGID